MFGSTHATIFRRPYQPHSMQLTSPRRTPLCLYRIATQSASRTNCSARARLVDHIVGLVFGLGAIQRIVQRVIHHLARHIHLGVFPARAMDSRSECNCILMHCSMCTSMGKGSSA